MIKKSKKYVNKERFLYNLIKNKQKYSINAKIPFKYQKQSINN